MLLLTALTPSLGKLRYLKTYFLSKDHELEEERFLNDTVASRSRLLTPPSFLDSNTTAKQAVDKQQVDECVQIPRKQLVYVFTEWRVGSTGRGHLGGELLQVLPDGPKDDGNICLYS